jgi:hypothetical protein
VTRRPELAAASAAPSTNVLPITAPAVVEQTGPPANHAHLRQLTEIIRVTSIIGLILAIGAAIGLIVVGYQGHSLGMAASLLAAASVSGLGWAGYLAATSWNELIHVVLEMDATIRDRSGAIRRR